MTQRELTTLILRIWGVMLVVDAIISIPPIISLMQPAGMSAETAQYIQMSITGSWLSVGATLLGGVLVVLLAPGLANRISPNTQVQFTHVRANDLQVAAVALLGLYFLITGLIHLGGPIHVLVSKPSWDETRPVELLLQQQFESVLQSTISIFCGLVLFIASRRILSPFAGAPSDAAV